MTAKKNSPVHTKHVLVISDQERLLSLFQDSIQFPGIEFTLVTSIAEGIKAAKKDAPFLLFIQGRIGGFSAEIIARHIILELKDSAAKIVLLCLPQDMPAPRNKAFYTSIDISQEDELLQSQVTCLVNSLLHGDKKKISAQSKSAGVKSASPRSRKKAAPEAKVMECLPEHLQDVRAEAVDIVEVGTASHPKSDHQIDADMPVTRKATWDNFSDKLNDALKRRIAVPPEGTVLSSEKSNKKTGKVALMVASVALVGGITLMFYHYYQSCSTSSSTRVQELGATVPAANEPDKVARVDETPEKKPQAPLRGYFKYTVRRGDTILSILKERLGFSGREAQQMIPEIREKNRLTRSSALRTGQSILIPVSLDEPTPSVKPGASATEAIPVAPKVYLQK